MMFIEDYKITQAEAKILFKKKFLNETLLIKILIFILTLNLKNLKLLINKK